MRIGTDKLEGVASILYGERRAIGAHIAAEIGAKPMTLWSWINRRGLPAEVALDLADALERKATAFARAAATLRRQATGVSPSAGTAPPS